MRSPSLAPRAHARRAALRAAMLLAGLAGCATDSTPITPYPIPVSMDAGVIMVRLEVDGDGELWPAVIDTMSPLTVVDGVALEDPPPRPERRRRELTIYSTGQINDAGVPVYVPQARFGGVNTFDLHPCAGAYADGEPCKLGFEGATSNIPAILGADLWSRVAIRFSFARRLISLFPDISGDNRDRALLCEAVFPKPFYGGGTLVISGAEVSFIGYRLAVGACLLAEAEATAGALLACPPQKNETGPQPNLPRVHGAVNALFLVSTGLPITLVSKSFHDRYLAACAALGVTCDTALGAPEVLHIASGPITVQRTTITDLALVSEYSDDRGPCQELYTNAFMLRCGNLPDGVDCCGDSEDENREGCSQSDQLLCPCEYREGDREEDRQEFCRSGAVAAIDRAVPVAVLADTHPLLQALRDEIRPELPELDGILAPSALATLEIDVDYPNNRMIVRDPFPTEPPDAGLPVHATRPAVINADTRNTVITVCAQ